eukprot:8005445-Pyramimonas_sp.AAC.1
MQKKKGPKPSPHKRYPGYGIDELNSPQRRDELAKAPHVGLVPLFMPCLSKAEYMGGATLEHLSVFIRDDIIMWAFSYETYTEFFKQNDTPIGQDLILLPEAGGDTRCDMATLREQSATAQEDRIAAILQLQAADTLEQRNMITTIRKARALLLLNDNHSMAEWRQLSE